MKRFIQWVWIFIALSFFMGCASFPLAKKDPKAVVEKKIHALMTARVNGEWDKVYEFYDSNFQKNISKKIFTGPKKVDFKSYRIEQIKADPSGEWVDALVKSDMTSGMIDLTDVPEKQHWIREKGKWVLVVKPVKSFID